MKVSVLTSTYQGFASVIIPYLVEGGVEVERIIFCEGMAGKKERPWKQKWKKVKRIGLLGALNGLRMRKWYDESPYRTLRPDPLDRVAEKHGIPFYRTPSVKDERTRSLLQESDASLGLSLGNGYIPQRIFSIPEEGMLNIHHEILPDFQGAQSVIWQLYEGNPETGFTIHFIDERIDQGKILYQERFPIEFQRSLKGTVVHNYTRSIQRSGEALAVVLRDWPFYRDAAWDQGEGRKYTTPSFGEFRRILKQHKRLRESCKIQGYQNKS